MLFIAGLNLKNLHPRVWDPASPYYLSQLRAVMVSYAEFHARPPARKKAMEMGLRAFLGVPEHVKVFLDNGAFSFLRNGKSVPEEDYVAFVEKARPDLYVVPKDLIPAPHLPAEEQRERMRITMTVNRQYTYDGFIPVLHISPLLDEYLEAFFQDAKLAAKPIVALGGIVPNLLRAPKALHPEQILEKLVMARQRLKGKHIHVFGVGGTATLHLTFLLGMDSVDSSSWRNRAARGIVLLPGRGERSVVQLGSWKGRALSQEEEDLLRRCSCPACKRHGFEHLAARGSEGFYHRAVHNLWVLLEELKAIEEHIRAGTYEAWFRQHLQNSLYRKWIERAWALRKRADLGGYQRIDEGRAT